MLRTPAPGVSPFRRSGAIPLRTDAAARCSIRRRTRQNLPRRHAEVSEGARNMKPD